MKSIDRQLDELYDLVDELLLADKFDQADYYLLSVDVPHTGIDILLGWLTITLAAKSKLPHRKDFFERVRKELEKRGRTEPGLLQGLE